MDNEKFQRAVDNLDGVSPLGADCYPFEEPEDAKGLDYEKLRAVAEDLRRENERFAARDASEGLAATLGLHRRLTLSDPVSSLAGDLLEMVVCEAMPPEEIERSALACRKAAEIVYARPPGSDGSTRPLADRPLLETLTIRNPGAQAQ